MKANRKSRESSEQSRFPWIVFAVLILLGMGCLAYVWGSGRSQTLGARIKKLERENEEAKKIRANEELKWQNMKTPANIDKALGCFNLKLVWPAESRIVRMRDPGGIEGNLNALNGEVAAASRKHAPQGAKP